ncbi:cobaltochelatase CobT-related protein [Aeromonas dhakensis]|uniref:cobaltochelatase CobT-related protein n=1 Tax=Aeromonas dhakensis TaxID=196024 RepID=UPI0038D1C924
MTAYTGLLTPVAVIRNSISAITQILAGRNITVHQRGLSAYVSYNERTGEPESVTLPYLPDDASDDLILAVQGFLDHEVGHLLFTENAAILEIAHDADWLHMENVLEDPYVEREMQRSFPGSKGTISRLHHFFLEKIVQVNYKKLMDAGSVNPLEFFGVLLPCISRAWHEFPVFEEYMSDKWGHVEPIMKKLPKDIASRVQAVKNTRDNVALARYLIDAIMRVPDEDEFDDTASDAGETSETSSPSSSEPSKRSGPSSRAKPSSPGLVDEEGDYDEEEEKDEEEHEEEVEDDHEPVSEPESTPESEPTPEPSDEAERGDDDAEGSGPSSDPEDDESKGTSGGEEEDEDEDLEGAEEFDDEADEEFDEDLGDAETGAKVGDSGPVSDDVDESSLTGKGGPKKAKSDESEEKGEGEGESEEKGEGEGEEPGEPAWTPGEGDSLTRYSVGDIESALTDSIAEMASSAAKKSSYVIYSTDHDVIEPYRRKGMENAAAIALPKIEALTKSQVGVMQNSLQRALVSKNKSYWRSSQESGRINPSSLARLYVGDTRVFRRKVEHRSKSFDVTLLIDCSGSMHHGTGSLSRFQTAMVAAYAMGDTLHRIGVNFEILGFTTKPHTGEWGETCRKEMGTHGITFGRIDWLYMPIFKSFEERWGPKQMERIGAAFHVEDFLRENVDGESVQIAAQRLIGQRSEGKMLIVLSDGAPACHTYDRTALNRHLSKSIKSAERAGIKVIGVGIDTDSVSRYYSDYIVLNDVTKLPTELVEQIQKVLLR